MSQECNAFCGGFANLIGGYVARALVRAASRLVSMLGCVEKYELERFVREVHTVGHSTHPIEDFIALLQSHSIAQVIDVRKIPRSRRNPQFNIEALAASVSSRAMAYKHMPELGGLRHAHRDSINTAWRNASFRGYADYMQTPEFQTALQTLLDLSAKTPTAIMCAEALPWKCHRSLIGDALLARGIHVLDIMSPTKAEPHALTQFAKVSGRHVTYPGKDQLNLALK
jgi:uncharacterized protein (DUF488 family)